jgi:hypothetical protein
LIYFKNTKDYLRIGNADRAVSASDLEAEKAWKLSWRRYWNHLEKIADRLGVKAYNFFRFGTEETGLHDGYLLSLNLGDSIGLSEKTFPTLRFGRGPSDVVMTILNYEKTRLHRFAFKGPRKVVIDIPSDDPLYFEEGKTLGQIHHYEVHSVSPKHLSAEWLLDSGGTILIEFEKLIYSCKLVKVPAKRKLRKSA